MKFTKESLAVIFILISLSSAAANGNDSASSTSNISTNAQKGCYDPLVKTWYNHTSKFNSSCLLCVCDTNSSITCYRNDRSLSKERQICSNCNMSSTSLQNACKTCLDNYKNITYYYSGERWKPDGCTVASCFSAKITCRRTVQRVSLFRPLSRISRSCVVASFIKKYPCKKCYDFMTRKWYNDGKIWGINKCFVCQCFAGRKYCARDRLPIVKNGILTYRSAPWCPNCNRRKLLSYIRKFKCKICIDNVQHKIRLHKELFRISWNTTCSCYDGVIKCMKRVSSDVASQFFLSRELTCVKCQTSQMKRFMNEKACHFMGKTISEGHASFIGFGDMPYCMKCLCFLGEIRCLYTRRARAFILSGFCMSPQMCTKINQTISKECQRDAALNCYNEAPDNVSWRANGCSYTCVSGKLKFNFVRKPWCQSIAKVTHSCAICPDKDDFLKKYGSIYTMCRRQPQAITHERICDGVVNCDDQTDEENCTTLYCRKSTTDIASKTFLWKRTPLDVTKTLGCDRIYKHWKGTTSRTCSYANTTGTFWTKFNRCTCFDTRKSLFSIEDLRNKSLSEMKEITSRLLNFSKEAVDLKQSLSMALVFIDAALQMEFYNISAVSTVLTSIGKKLNELRKSSPCQDDEEKELKNTLKFKLITFQMKFMVLFSLYHGHVKHGHMKLWVKYDALFVPELLFGKSSKEDDTEVVSDETQTKLLGGRGRLMMASPGNNNNFSINNETFPNISHANATYVRKIKKQTISKKILIHLKIQFGLDLFLSMVSLVALMIAVSLLFLLKIQKTTKLFIRKNLFMAMMIATLAYVVGTWSESSLIKYRGLCSTFLIFHYYTSMAMFSWMTIEGINILLVIVIVFQGRSKRHLQYAAFGWGTPLVILVICFGIKPDAFLQSSGCIGMGMNVWLFKGPAAILLSVNTILFLVILWALLRHMASSARLKSSPDRLKSSLRAFFALVPLLGVSYSLGFTVQSSPIVMGYIFVLVNGVLGLAFAILHCFMDPQIIEAFAKFRERARSYVQWESGSSSGAAQRQASNSFTSIVPVTPTKTTKNAEQQVYDTKL